MLFFTNFLRDKDDFSQRNVKRYNYDEILNKMFEGLCGDFIIRTCVENYYFLIVLLKSLKFRYF